MDFLVGSFNQSSLYLFAFDPSTSTLKLTKEYPAIAGHSWLSLSKDKKNLYCTAWTTKPSIAAYKVAASSSPGHHEISYLNSKPVKSTPGYVCSNSTHIFSVSGPSGEVFLKEPDGSLGPLVQVLDFVTHQGSNHSSARGGGEVPHGDFGGLRHGAHSVDISPDGKSLFIADIGRNCIWTYRIITNHEEPLSFGTKHISPRSHDGPRHTIPHPNGKVLYTLQEHSSMIDIFSIASDGITLSHLQGTSTLPPGKDYKNYWADEVRYSTGPDPSTPPKYLFASNRGLSAETKGYVAAYKLKEDGMLDGEEAIDIWETPTSGGIANAIEPAPWKAEHGEMEYLALCDSEEGWVSILSFDGKSIQEVSKVNLGKTEDGKVVGAATPVWL